MPVGEASLKKFLWHLYEGFGKTKAMLVVLVLAVYGLLVMQSGGSLLQLLWFAVVVAAYIVLPGLFWVRILKTNRFAKGMAGPLALLLGCGFFAVTYCVAMYMHIVWLLRLLPPALGLVWVGITLYKNGGLPKIAFKKPAPRQWMLMLLYAALLLFFTFYGVVKHARPLAVGDILPNHDLLWNIGNANSFKLGFPPQDIRFVGVRLHYHYLTELLAGALSLVSGISAYNIVAFYMQAFMLAALVLCSYSFGRVMWSKGDLQPLLFAYMPFLFGCASLWKILPNGWSVFINSNVTHLITNINGQTTAITFLYIFLALLVPIMRQKYKAGFIQHALALSCFVMLCFAKGPLAAIVVCSLVLTLLIGLLQKNTTWRGLLFGLIAAAVFVFVYVTMFNSGASDSMPLSFSGTLTRGYFNNIQNLLYNKNPYVWYVAVPVLWLLQSFLSMPGQFALYVRVLFHDVRHFTKIPQERMLAHGVVVGGLLAFFLFNHPHLSQIYFLFAAVVFVNLLAVDGIGYLKWPAKRKKKQKTVTLQRVFVGVVAVCAAVGLITNGFLYVHYMGSGGRQLLRNLGVTEKYPYDVVVTPDDEAAMLWLQANSPEDAMFATNRIHTGARAEGISNLYSAYSGRQAFMEGFQYAKTNMGVAEDIILQRLEVNNALFSAGTPPEEVMQLCRDNGITYLVYSTQLPGDETQLSFLPMVFSSPTVRIYKVS